MEKGLLERHIGSVALDFLGEGLSLFQKNILDGYLSYQVATANLGISIELMLKIYLLCDGFNNIFEKRFCLRECCNDIELRVLKKSMPIYHKEFFDRINHLLSTIPDIRNDSVHSILPSYHKYKMCMSAFLAIKLFYHLRNNFGDRLEEFRQYKFNDYIQTWFTNFNEEQLDNAIKTIQDSEKNILKQNKDYSEAYIETWKHFQVECPINQHKVHKGTLYGETNVEIDHDDNGKPIPRLYFIADSFKCDICEHSIRNIDEMIEYYNLDIVYDRSNEYDKWLSEFGEGPFIEALTEYREFLSMGEDDNRFKAH